MSRHLQHRLHTQLRTATALLDLPLTEQHIERLAVEMTAPVKALLAEAVAGTEEQAPLPVTVTAPVIDTGTRPYFDEAVGVATSEYGGCVNRFSLDVDLGSPAVVLAEQLRRQPDVTATDIPTATFIGLTVRPPSLHAWAWWLHKLNIGAESVTIEGDAAHAVGEKDGVAVQLCGDGVPALLTDRAAARLAGVLVEPAVGHPW
ncbi:hypothetical protein [Streptomyces graminilatus]|uniref:hypothetical protein n=1 Tax=Streptomyces graminilatus TaxID=1464070 RepID=UPI0006E3363A|nr:hypothetical protein [Streptomyces graminilatus]